MTTPVPSAPLGLLSRTLIEALDSVAARDQVQMLLRRALLNAGLEAVPEEAEAFRHFAAGALTESIERVLGEGAAEMVLDQMRQVLRVVAPVVARQATGTGDDEDELSGEHAVDPQPSASARGLRGRARPDITSALRGPEALVAPVLFPPRATSYESGTQRKRAHVARASRDPSDPSMPREIVEEERSSPSRSGPRPIATDVIVVSLDPRLVKDLEARMQGRSRVKGVLTISELMAALTAAAGGRIAIVLDTGVPSIDVPTFASLGATIPPGTHVVLWGTDERHKARLVRMFPQVTGWVASGAAASPAELLDENEAFLSRHFVP